MKKQTSVFENSLIWFGAGVSIAEILTGTYFAPLGFEKGILFQIVHSFAPPTVPAHLYSPPFVLPVPSCGFGYD